jgi:hypothetical protein
LNFATKYLLVTAVLTSSAMALPVYAQTPSTDQAAPAGAAPSTASPQGSTSSAPGASSAPGSKHGFKIPELGINLGIFVPSDAKTRNRFGSVWTGIGLGIGKIYMPSGGGSFGLDLGLSGETSGSNYAYIAPVGVSYRRAFSAAQVKSGDTFIPYFGFTADLVGVDLRSPQDNVHPNVQFTVGGSASIGTTIGKSGFAEARYAEIGRVEGFDLSGVGLTVGVRF